jgi:hypothetical protein
MDQFQNDGGWINLGSRPLLFIKSDCRRGQPNGKPLSKPKTTTITTLFGLPGAADQAFPGSRGLKRPSRGTVRAPERRVPVGLLHLSELSPADGSRARELVTALLSGFGRPSVSGHDRSCWAHCRDPGAGPLSTRPLLPKTAHTRHASPLTGPAPRVSGSSRAPPPQEHHTC